MQLHVGMVGLGNLGAGMARRLTSTGHDVSGYDVVPDAVAALGSHGVRAAASVADLAAEVDLLCLVVSDAHQTEEVLFGTDGVVRGLAGRRGLVLLHSTIGPAAAQDLAHRCSEHGLTLVDAPVSGGADAAEAGRLAIMIGCDGAIPGPAIQVFNALGGPTERLGPVGAGQAVKIANQMFAFTAQAALLEALSLTSALGVENQRTLDVFQRGLADSWVVRNWGFFDSLSAEYDQAGVPPESRPWNKDLKIALDVCRSMDLDIPVTRTVESVIGRAIDRHGINGR
ncbi:3-hydroxyisobutyrate dehydrogenase-like beta-hydroxyacid dehydrogenase [Arthrobacter sp. CAN_A6]|uniref:NAD(P)-dependent oxidoreductase n=1 Tax=Arthrobacter sp. CAN_A6 TaxID=2787721 RepID=UPI0018CA7341